MEKKLKSMFEYQRFAANDRLSRIIAETEERYGREIDDDDLWMVNAAGAPVLPDDDKKRKLPGVQKRK